MNAAIKFAVPDQIVRALTWDGVPHALVPEVLAALGLVGESEDVREMEHTASHARSETLRGLILPIAKLCNTMGLIQAGKSIADATEAGLELPDGALEMTAMVYSQLGISSVVAVLSQLNSAGLITVNEKIRS